MELPKDLKLKPNALIAVDLDGTLSEGECWGAEDPKPKQDMIDFINSLYIKGYHIIIYTARFRDFFQLTEAWLIKHRVRYHALCMNKMGADLYIDDKCINIKDLLKE